MKLSLGIVGLPNVGKSTLFNALTKQQVLAANYPFATIDPNVGVVPVNDIRIKKLAEVQKPGKVIPAAVEFVDIAGLVKGASEGEGLGNKFLGNIREVSAIVHVVRAFENEGITHVENSVDPLRDIDLIHTELILKDMEIVSKRIDSIKSKAKSHKDLALVQKYLEELLAHLEAEHLANTFDTPDNDDIKLARKELMLLTDKPFMFLLNVSSEKRDEEIKKLKDFLGHDAVVVGMDFAEEADLAGMTDEEREMFMEELGLEESGLDKVTSVAYNLLGLISYFTCGPMEVRAWTIKKGDNAPEAAGVIHTDIQQNFIAADIVNWADFVEYGGWNAAKDNGKVRLEGKTYIMQDGDTVLFKHNG